MSAPGEDGLVTTEGVDEGSAASTAESKRPDGARADEAGVGGSGTLGRPRTDSDPAGPVDMESADSRAARAATGSGQQLAEGEG